MILLNESIMAEAIFHKKLDESIAQHEWRVCGDIGRFYLEESLTRINIAEIPDNKRSIYIDLFNKILIGVRGGGNDVLAKKVAVALRELVETTVNIEMTLREKIVKNLQLEGVTISRKTIGYMFYWDGCVNFGDIIGEYIFRKTTGMKFAGGYITERGRGVIQSAGSLLTDNNNQSINWGPGVMHYFKEIERDQLTLAVRGPYTIRRMKELNIISSDIPMGDPGILLPKFYHPQIKPTYRLGLIPHYDDYNTLVQTIADAFQCSHDDVLSKLEQQGIKIINIQNQVEPFIDDILTCQHIVSSSLHGVIAAVVYGIPTRWLRLGNRLYGDDVKFFDFFMSLLWSPNNDNKDIYDRLVDIVHRGRIGEIPHQKLMEDPNYDLIKYIYPVEFTPDFDEIISQTHLFNFSAHLPQKLWEACPYDSSGWKDKYLDQITEYLDHSNN